MQRVLSFLVMVGFGTATLAACGTVDHERDVGVLAYSGLGAWVDVYDYAPAFQENAASPRVLPESVDDMADLGVQTLYLQAGFTDPRAPEDDVVDRDLVEQFVERARTHEIAVVAWYLPRLGDLDADLRLVGALAEFEHEGEGFDSIALDIEWTADVPEVEARNAALIELSQRARDLVGDGVLGAIVFPPVQTEVVNPALWPDFPWQEVEPLYDVWLPMAYWTFRDGEFRDAYRYVAESVRRLRANLGDPEAVVHAIGGLADTTTPADLDDLRRAVRDEQLIGWSLYDYDITPSSLWPRLRF